MNGESESILLLESKFRLEDRHASDANDSLSTICLHKLTWLNNTV